MSIDTKTAGRVAKLAQIKVEEADLPAAGHHATERYGAHALCQHLEH